MTEPESSTLRVLHHVVSTYQDWREQRLGVPNEFTDDAIRIGEQHLREQGWWPAPTVRPEPSPLPPTFLPLLDDDGNPVVRPPKKGEWYAAPDGGVIQARRDWGSTRTTIYTRTETER